MAGTKRISRQSQASAPIPTLDHDAVAVALQAALGSRVLLIRAIGQGGMGRVYLARDPQLKRFVAVKVLIQSSGHDAEAHARFQREAQAIAAVSHPNVVDIYGVGELPDGRPYFIMQYVSGGSMADRLAASGPLPVEMAESVLGDVAAALSAAHRRGIVHRDVKPANVLWDEEGDRATVSDFGIAMLLKPADGEEQDPRITGSGMAVGSPAYMSPEQLLTEPATPKSDIYALGLLGYELLTAHGPYRVTSPSQLVAAHLREKPRRLSEVRTDIPEELQELLLRCLAKEPDDRPTAEEVMLAMRPGAADALEWPPPGLERLHGELWRLLTMPAAGVMFLLVPLLMLVAIDRSDYGDSSILAPLLLGASSVIGFVAFLRGGVRAWSLISGLARAANLDYGWGTITEVLSDRRGDTGALIAGTREYGTLSPPERVRLRVLRMIGTVLLFLAAPLALAVAVVALALYGSDQTAPWHFIRLVVCTLAGVAGLGLLAGTYEATLLSRARRKRAERPRRTNDDELAPAWYSAFERSREGQRFGRGRTVSRRTTILVAAAGTAAVLFCAAIVLTVSVVVVLGQVTNGVVGPSQMSYLTFQAQRTAGGTTYRTPPSDSVTPKEAGAALLAVASASSGPRTPSPIEQRIDTRYRRWTRVFPPKDLFPRQPELHWTGVAVREAARGLTAEQRDVLQRAAAHPARAEFSRAASARTVDVYGALLKLPFQNPIHFASFPMLGLYGLRDAAESHAALVALDIADKRPQDAERHAREIISVGSQLLDMPFVMQNATGFDVLARGVSTLESVYIASGREAEARVLLDSVVTASARTRRFWVGPGAPGFARAARNDHVARGVRMEILMPLLMRACSDPKQLLFGVDETYRRNVQYARDSLARFPSERAWVDALDGMLSLGVSPARESTGFLTKMASWVDRIVGGRRFESCAGMVATI